MLGIVSEREGASIRMGSAKASANLRRHKISFEEAISVFLDDKALLIPDEAHSTMEDRFILLGMSTRLRMLVVCHCYRQSEEIIRLISARKANRVEQAQYQERA
jgi:uncharacterized DUF497 family protein